MLWEETEVHIFGCWSGRLLIIISRDDFQNLADTDGFALVPQGETTHLSEILEALNADGTTNGLQNIKQQECSYNNWYFT